MIEPLTRSIVADGTSAARRGQFEFGSNWAKFLPAIGDERIAAAEDSLKRMLEVETLRNTSFLDVGSGSGLFSLAAWRLGARVHSFDCDPESVRCTQKLKQRFSRDDRSWTIEEGSVLDDSYVRGLGAFDVVYSWGVLHHTGRMWEALDKAALPVAKGGRLFIAIYNDTGSQSARWKRVKQMYNTLPVGLRLPFLVVVSAPAEAKRLLRGLWSRPLAGGRSSSVGIDAQRGMSRWRDAVDWVGGYPYEVAKPDEIFDFYRARGFSLTKLKCGGVGLGCNEFVFVNQTVELPR